MMKENAAWVLKIVMSLFVSLGNAAMFIDMFK